MAEEVGQVADFLSNKSFYIHETSKQSVWLNDQKLVIPVRVYFDVLESNAGKNLSDLQQTILNCIYLRHDNGFVRQERLNMLLQKTDYFTTPFTFQLLGEYVIEILYDLDRYINGQVLENYRRFIIENPRYWEKTQSRVVSYWDVYYRRSGHHNFNQYIGKKILNRLRS